MPFVGSRLGFRRLHFCLVGLAMVFGGCAAQGPSKPSVSQAYRRTGSPPRAAASPERTTAKAPEVLASAGNGEDAIAYVDGRPISRDRVVNLLLAGHGVGILEQVAVLEKARAMAAEQGIKVSQRDIDAEFDRSLRNMLSSFEAAGEDAPFDRDEAERVLEEVLARRNVSRDECMMVVTRNAYLRAICVANMTFTEEQLADVYQCEFGPRVQIRHIQVRNLADAERVQTLIDANADFAELARQYSANLRTAPAGGLLRPFCLGDPDVPVTLSTAAFALEPGQVSNPIRVEDWYHIIKLERKIPADSRPLGAVRAEVEQRLRERLTDPAMQTLYRSLFEQADIRVEDPVLAREFARKHPDRAKRR